MKGADLPVSIHPNDHLAHHHILLKPPGLANCQRLGTSNHLRIIQGTKGAIKGTGHFEKKRDTWNIAKVVVTGWWWTARGTGSRSWIGCTVTRSPCWQKMWVLIITQVQQPLVLRQASWSVRVQQGRPHYMHLPSFPRGRSHAGPAVPSTPNMLQI